MKQNRSPRKQEKASIGGAQTISAPLESERTSISKYPFVTSALFDRLVLMELNIRKARTNDVDPCIDLRGKTNENSFSRQQLSELGITQETWEESIDSGYVFGFVCTHSERIVGFFFGDTVTGEIVVLAVHSRFEGMGIGRRLLQRMQSTFKKSDFKKLFLGCSSDPATRSYGFYRHLGWVSTGQFDIEGDEILEYVL